MPSWKPISPLFDWQQLSLLIILAGVWASFGSMSGAFLTQSNILTVVLQASATIVSAVGMTYVISTRGIDLSVGAIALCSVSAAVMIVGKVNNDLAMYADVSWLAFPFALGVGLCLGVVNAVLIIVLRLNPLIATLGSMALDRGVGLHITQASSIPVRGGFVDVVRTSIVGVSTPVIVAVAFSIVGIFVVWQTPFGRRILALGHSPRSALEIGISGSQILVVAYGLSGLCAAVAGVLTLGRVGMLDATLGLEFEFTVITAVVLGGTSLFGGSSRIAGTFVTAILLVSVENGLNIIGANPYAYQFVQGAVLLIATTITVLSDRKKLVVGYAANAAQLPGGRNADHHTTSDGRKRRGARRGHSHPSRDDMNGTIGIAFVGIRIATSLS